MITFVSCFPFRIIEDMPHINPSHYEVEAAENNDFSILHIDNATDHVYAGDGKYVDRIVLAAEIAENLRRMVCLSQMGLGENASPGIIILEGKLSKTEVEKNHGAKLKIAQAYQRNWYKNLVLQADDMWKNFRLHRMISSLHRFACTALNLTREWNVVIDSETGPVFCPACGSGLPNSTVTVCGTCRTIINPKEHEKLFGKAAIA